MGEGACGRGHAHRGLGGCEAQLRCGRVTHPSLNGGRGVTGLEMSRGFTSQQVHLAPGLLPSLLTYSSPVW